MDEYKEKFPGDKIAAVITYPSFNISSSEFNNLIEHTQYGKLSAQTIEIDSLDDFIQSTNVDVEAREDESLEKRIDGPLLAAGAATCAIGVAVIVYGCLKVPVEYSPEPKVLSSSSAFVTVPSASVGII